MQSPVIKEVCTPETEKVSPELFEILTEIEEEDLDRAKYSTRRFAMHRSDLQIWIPKAICLSSKQPFYDFF